MVDNRETDFHSDIAAKKKNDLMHANFKGADQPAHWDSLIKAFFLLIIQNKAMIDNRETVTLVLGLVARKPALFACKPHRCRSACVYLHSDQHILILSGKYFKIAKLATDKS